MPDIGRATCRQNLSFWPARMRPNRARREGTDRLDVASGFGADPLASCAVATHVDAASDDLHAGSVIDMKCILVVNAGSSV